MTGTKTVFENILDKIVARLETLTRANGYDFDINGVEERALEKTFREDLKAILYVGDPESVAGEGSEAEATYTGYDRKQQPCVVRVWSFNYQPDLSADRRMIRIWKNVAKCLRLGTANQDHDWLKPYANIPSVGDFHIDDDWVGIPFTVDYDHVRDDPTTGDTA